MSDEEIVAVNDVNENARAEKALESDTASTGEEHSTSLREPSNQSKDMMKNADLSTSGGDLLQETKLLRDTLDLLWNHTSEQRQLCEQLKQENEYLQDYISNLMTSSNVLDK